jgi:mevalonate kinase
MAIISEFGAKLILFGEHSVVHGYHSALIPLDLKLTAEVEFNNRDIVVLNNRDNDKFFKFEFPLNSINYQTDEPNRENLPLHVLAILRYYLKERDVELKGMNININSDIPNGGFGGSASYIAGIVDSVIRLHGLELSKEELLKLVVEGENFQHGSSSGVDPAVIVNNQPIIYSKAEGVKKFKISNRLGSLIRSHLYVLSTGREGLATKDLVDVVGRAKSDNPTKIESLFDQIESNLEEFLNFADRELSLEELIRHVNTNGRLLEELGVVSDPILKVSREIRELGDGIKISGAGGVGQGGSGAVIIISEDFERIADVVAKYIENPHFLNR